MDIKQIASDFWENGFVVLDNFFDADLMDELHQLSSDHYGVDPQFYHNEEFLKKSNVEVIPWFPQMENVKAFDKVDSYPHFNGLTQEILGDDWRCLYSMVMFSKAGTKGQAWHQDCAPEDPEVFNLNRLIYTNDILPENGGQVLVVPKSHKRPILTVGEPTEDFDDQVVLVPKRGTLVLVHGHTWHRVLPVKMNHRISTNFRAVPKKAPDNVTDVCVYRNMRYDFSINEVVEERV